MEGKRIQDSEVVLAQIMQPESANILGNVHGGWIMKLMDEAGAIVASRHARRPTVTVVVDSIQFCAPVHVGDLVHVRARMTQAWRTSMEVEIQVEAEDLLTGERRLTATAYFVYVAWTATAGPPRCPRSSWRPRRNDGRRRKPTSAGRNGWPAARPGKPGEDARITPGRPGSAGPGAAAPPAPSKPLSHGRPDPPPRGSPRRPAPYGRLAQDHNPLAHEDGLLDVVGDQDQGQGLFFLQTPGQLLQVLPGGRIQRREGLVHQQQVRLQHQGAGDGRPLALPPRDLPRVIIPHGGQPQALQPGVHRPLDLRHRRVRRRVTPVRPVEATDAQAQGDVLPYRGPGQEPVILKDQAGARARPSQGLSVDPDLPPLGRRNPASR
jgi:acyl-CoA hydrolase